MALSADEPRKYASGVPGLLASLPVAASTTLYEGAALGLTSTHARAFTDGDTFLGFAIRKADNSAGAAADIAVEVRTRGIVKLTVAGSGSSAPGAAVYATADNTFSITDSGSDTQIGKLHQQVDDTAWLVYFESTPVRSV